MNVVGRVHTLGYAKGGGHVLGCNVNHATGEPCQMVRPVARTTDPGTSHAAARSVTDDTIRRSQTIVLDILSKHGPQTDESIWQYVLLMQRPDWPSMSPSGARTRRRELVDAGRVRDSGRRSKLHSNRWAIVWEAVPAADGGWPNTGE